MEEPDALTQDDPNAMTDEAWQSVLRAVDDRECAQCHEFGALDRHPEFAVVNAAITTGLGIKFDHDRHVIEVVSGGLERCQSCHVPTIDQAAFEPIDFDDHCQACHVDAEGFVTGRTDPLAPEYVLAPDEVPEPWAAESEIAITPAARGRSEFGKMRHRDRWRLSFSHHGTRYRQTAFHHRA